MNALLLALCLTSPSALDGDTFKACGVSVRLSDYDTPELFSPRCPREYALALAAKAELERALPTITYTVVPCATTNHGRLCAYVPGLASLMINKGLAVPYPYVNRRNWC